MSDPDRVFTFQYRYRYVPVGGLISVIRNTELFVNIPVVHVPNLRIFNVFIIRQAHLSLKVPKQKIFTDPCKKSKVEIK